jgi:hypothetical protein
MVEIFSNQKLFQNSFKRWGRGVANRKRISRNIPEPFFYSLPSNKSSVEVQEFTAYLPI